MRVDSHAQVFRSRRKRFIEAIANAVAVLPSAPIAIRSNDVEFVYRQDNDFHYLTGFPEPEAVAVFAPGGSQGEFILFVRPRDPEREVWTGKRAGVEGAAEIYGADKAYPISELEKILPGCLENADRVYYPLGGNERMNQRMIEFVRMAQAMRPRLGSGATGILDPREIIHEMRLFKSPEELETMRRAVAISTDAHVRAMREARPGMVEWEVEALVDYEFRRHGGSPAYPSIVASGRNATVLHYIENDCEIRPGELLLIDAGCEYECYASDVTRTFPAGGRFSPAQRDLYELVLEAQRAAIEKIAPGAPVEEPHNAAVRVLVEGMLRCKLLNGSAEEAMTTGSYRRFYMHRTSHWLGMDVHDVGLYRREGKSRKLEAGMVLTVEPGIYIGSGDASVAESYRGIGIRIEDDVLVTPTGHEVLSAAVPKRIEEIERFTVS